jgi:hypothetical protein
MAKINALALPTTSLLLYTGMGFTPLEITESSGEGNVSGIFVIDEGKAGQC